MTAEQLLARIAVVCARGGDVFVAADTGSSYSARVRLATPWKSGTEVHTGVGSTVAEALAAALARAPR